MDDTLPVSLFRSQWPKIKSNSAWLVRDVALIDFARYIAMRSSFDLETITADTTALHDALKAKADEMNLPLDRHPLDIDFEILEPFAVAWAEKRAAERASETRS